MNKLTSGAIVGTLGIALLLGGAGTFATWNQSTTANAGTVASGTLTIAKTGTTAPTWKNISADAVAGGVAIANIATYKIVPGDTLQMTQVFTVAATGDNLKATLAYDPTSVTTVSTADAALKAETTFALAATGTGVTTDATTKAISIAPNANGTSQVTVTLTVALPKDVSGVTAQGGSLNLSAVSFSLTQNTRA
jgi:alternate signal-mediated exported protein